MSVRPLTVATFVPYPLDTAPSQRYRIEQWAPYLADRGISLEMRPFATTALLEYLYAPGHHLRKTMTMAVALARSVMSVRELGRFDAVLVHRGASLVGPAVIERLAARSGRPLIYDFDDAIFLLHTSPANRFTGWLKFPGKTATICRLASHVTVGNEYLATYARRYNDRVTIIPTSIDTAAYRPAPERRAARVVVGWTGSATSQGHLELFAPLLLELSKRRDVTIRVVSNRRPDLPGVPHEWYPWSADTEIAQLSAFDIGIMPMPDDDFSRGKCSLKALQYMAMGVPTICSPVGANRELIAHGENGLLASQPDEWLVALESLIDDEGMRRRLGAAGRQTVEERFSKTRCAEILEQVIRSEVGRARAGHPA